MAKVVLVSRAVYWRQWAVGWVGGFFVYRLLQRFVSPRVMGEVATVLAISMFVLIFTDMSRKPRFLDHDKDQALLDRLSAFLYRHHLWDQFQAEDTQGKR